MYEETIPIPPEFADICPIQDKDFHNEMSMLVQEPALKHIIGLALPDYKYSQLVRVLLGLNSKHELQTKIIRPFLDGLLAKTSTGLTSSGIEELGTDTEKPFTFITNHRDIVLDSAQLGAIMLQNGRQSCEIAIGNNLLIYNWITKLVQLNKCFIVKRNLGRMQTLAAAIQLSRYVHFVITQKKCPVWIAQREGRCKDGNDRTQESLIKMLTYGNREVSFTESLKELNIAPVAISYEYDPNDRLKAYEYLLKSKNPNFKKSQQDDLDSMKTGLVEFKGHIHYTFTPCINDELEKIPTDLDRMLTVQRICHIIDHQIHASYRIYKTNYIAHDLLLDNKDFAEHYSEQEEKHFRDYLNSQLDKLPEKFNDSDRNYMLKYMLQMYSNPLTNQLEALK